MTGKVVGMFFYRRAFINMLDKIFVPAYISDMASLFLTL
jgi:hypothetical protein